MKGAAPNPGTFISAIVSVRGGLDAKTAVRLTGDSLSGGISDIGGDGPAADNPLDVSSALFTLVSTIGVGKSDEVGGRA